MVDLSEIKKGDFVVFKNGEIARVREFRRYDVDRLDIFFDRPVFGRINSCSNWNYFNNGLWIRQDLSLPSNDIVKILENNNESD